MRTQDLTSLLRLLDQAPAQNLLNEQHASDLREEVLMMVAKVRLYERRLAETRAELHELRFAVESDAVALNG